MISILTICCCFLFLFFTKIRWMLESLSLSTWTPLHTLLTTQLQWPGLSTLSCVQEQQEHVQAHMQAQLALHKRSYLASHYLCATHCTSLHTFTKYQMNGQVRKIPPVEVLLLPVFAPPVKYNPEFSLTLLFSFPALTSKIISLNTHWHFLRILNTI